MSINRLGSNSVLLGIDLGTSHMKARIYDTNGRCLGAASAPVPMLRSCPGCYEQNTDSWWALLRKMFHKIRSATPKVLDRIAVVSVCGQSHGPTPYSKAGKPLGNCISWLDQRGQDQVEWMLEHIGEEEFVKEGNLPIDTCYTAAKLLWLKYHRPKLYQTTHMFLLPKDVLIYRLTDKFSTDFTDASVTNLFSCEKRDWSSRLIGKCGLDPAKFPQVKNPWDIIGEVTTKAAEETGLRPGIPVIAGAADWACLYYGAGGVRPNVIVDLAGTVGGIMITTGEGSNLPKLLSVLPNLRNSIAGSMEASSVIYEWFLNEFYKPTFGDQVRPFHFADLDAEASRIPAGSGGIIVLPHFAGARRPQKENSKGTIFGLSLGTKRAQIARAIVEGCAFQTRRAVERILESGTAVDAIRSIGGSARSLLWRQIKADVVGVPYLRLNHEEVGAFGAAMIGGYALGVFPSLEDPIDRFTHVEEEALPNRANETIYNGLYNAYCYLSDLLEQSSVYDELDNAMGKTLFD